MRDLDELPWWVILLIILLAYLTVKIVFHVEKMPFITSWTGIY